MKQTGKIWTGRALHILAVVLIFFCLITLLGQSEWKSFAIVHYAGTDGYREENWTLSSEGQILNNKVALPGFMTLEPGREYILSTDLTYDGRADNLPYCFFYIHHMYCSAWLDGEQIFTYMPEDLPDGLQTHSPGNVHVGLPMPKDCQGKHFEIRFLPLLSCEVEYELPFATFGDYATTLRNQFIKDLPHNIVGILAAFLGVIAILFSAMALQGREYREGTFIGIFALIFSIYNMTECTFNLYLISNPFYVYLINYTAFSLMPAFLLAFLREKFQSPIHRRACSLMILAGFCILAAEYALQFTGVLDMREFLKYLHMEYFADMAAVLILVITMRQGRDKKTLILQLLPLSLGILMDLISYYFHWELVGGDAPFSSMGIMVFLLIEIRHVWRSSIDIYMESIRSHYYQEMAYEDKLTGVGNRRAFESEKMEIQSGVRKAKTILVASADVNDLKQTNDTLGHAEGDYLIKSTAWVLSSMTKKRGSTFRTGGDEFIQIFYDVSPQELEQLMTMARARVAMLNESGHAHLSIAYGYEKVEDLDIASAVQKADRKMYIDKGMTKEARKTR